MSYNIAVVNFKLPDNYEEAVELLKPLSSIEVKTIEPEYQKFHDEVTKRFPCFSMLEDIDEEEEVVDCVWCDGPLIDNFMVKAPVIGFTFNGADEALEEVVYLALDMGLSVLDWQMGMVFNPRV